MKTFQPEFVEFIPIEKKPGILYISIPYKTAVHSCFCGCGNIIFTPLIEGRWSMVFQAGKVSLYPSIGSRNLECRSHYFLTKNEVDWLKPFSDNDEDWASDKPMFSIFDWIPYRSPNKTKRKRKK